MNLKVVGTGSKGNSYLLQPEEGKSIILECGVNHKEIKKAFNFNTQNIAGSLITHEHQDHCKYAKQIAEMGIDVYATAGTLESIGLIKSHRAKKISSKKAFMIGDFKILPFDIKHDAAEPVGFIINHKESGNILFLTDTVYSPYKFANLNNIIMEINFSEEILDKNLIETNSNSFLRNRILGSHFSLENAVELLKINDVSNVNKIVLIHLSDTNSNEELFKQTIIKNTGKDVVVANNGMDIEINKIPF